jgi:hypothetical protein
MIRIKSTQQPHQLDIATTLRLQPARRANGMQVTVQVQLQQIPRIIAGAACLCRFRPLESKLRYQKTIYECVNYTAHVIGRHKIIQHHGKQRTLIPSLA